MQSSVKELLTPRKINVAEKSKTRAQVTLEPLERGFGHTLGNALRRILLSSMPGCAITEVEIDAAGVSTLFQDYSEFDLVDDFDIQEAEATGGSVTITPEQYWSLPQEAIDKIAKNTSFSAGQMSEQDTTEVDDLVKEFGALNEEEVQAATRKGGRRRRRGPGSQRGRWPRGPARHAPDARHAAVDRAGSGARHRLVPPGGVRRHRSCPPGTHRPGR